MYVETRLIIIHIDYDSGNSQCLINNNILPSKIIKKSHPIDSCPTILTQFLEIEPVWVRFILVDIDYQDDTLIIYYTCVIPSIVKNFKGDWLDIGSTNDDIQKVVLKAAQKIIARNF